MLTKSVCSVWVQYCTYLKYVSSSRCPWTEFKINPKGHSKRVESVRRLRRKVNRTPKVYQRRNDLVTF